MKSVVSYLYINEAGSQQSTHNPHKYFLCDETGVVTSLKLHVKNCFRKHCKTFNKFLQRNDGGRSCNITSHHTTTCNTNIILCCACNIFCVGNSEFSLLQAEIFFFFCSLIISYRIISQIPSLVYLFMGLRLDPTCVRIHFFQVCMLLLQRRAKIELGVYAFISQPPPYQHQKLWTDFMSKISLEHFTFLCLLHVCRVHNM